MEASMAAWVGWGTVPARARDASGLDGIEGREGGREGGAF